jgi:Xaa-Pro dipeptidase
LPTQDAAREEPYLAVGGLGRKVAVTAAAATAATGERLERLRAAAGAAGLDAFVATSDESIAYLTGFRPLQLERLFAVVVRTDGAGAVVVPRLDLGQLRDAPGELAHMSYEASSDGLGELVAGLSDAHRVGVEEDHLVFGRAVALRNRGVELVAAASMLAALRWRKDEAEVERVRAACELVEEALTWAFARLRPGSVEFVVNAEVESWLRERGAAAAHPLILFGENAANPHGQPGERELRLGDVVCDDVSACLDGYWGDLTRCATAGPASNWAREAWQLVHEAQAAAIAACRPGVAARDVDGAQRRLIESRPDLGACLHGAGHAIGLAVHEPPFLVPRTETPLEEGMIFTIEPGIYLSGTGGIRLEDDVVVRADGPDILSSLPLDLFELAA